VQFFYQSLGAVGKDYALRSIYRVRVGLPAMTEVARCSQLQRVFDVSLNMRFIWEKANITNVLSGGVKSPKLGKFFLTAQHHGYLQNI
jgi:hypothetical protein